jgi:hypothetical protein
LIYGNQLDVPVLEWCKLFGSDDAEKQLTHWKNVATDKDAFKAGLLTALGIDGATFDAYWQEMKKYRDTNVAHHDPRREHIRFYPKLDLALDSACYYFDYVRDELLTFRIDQQPNDIRKYSHDFEENCVEVATVAIKATAHLHENF